ncbi:MAG TPA: hypothetical protein VJM49_19615 [Acidimicrobiales bacterium]|nr:hypothetical protein [Acidimicrobiales bacterium]
MSVEDDAAAALADFVDVGPTVREVELGAAVAEHIASRPTQRRSEPDPELVAALRERADHPLEPLHEVAAFAPSPLLVNVDFNGLLTEVGEPDVWRILGELKDLFGGTP